MNVALIIAVAILIEGLVEYGKNITEMFYGGEKKTAITQMVTIVVGIGLLGLTVNHYIGMVLTGIVMSRGSNYVSDLIGKIGQTTVG